MTMSKYGKEVIHHLVGTNEQQTLSRYFASR